MRSDDEHIFYDICELMIDFDCIFFFLMYFCSSFVKHPIVNRYVIMIFDNRKAVEEYSFLSFEQRNR